MFAFTLAAMTLWPNQIVEIARNSDFSTPDLSGKLPKGFELSGGARYEYAGYQDEVSTKGVVLDSSAPSGSVSQTVAVDPKKGKWLRFRIRGRAEDGFQVQNDQLFLELDFYGNGGKTYQDKVKRLIYREILADRRDFAVNGDDHKSGASVWRSYDLEELLPFAETDSVTFTIGFSGGAGKQAPYDRFMISNFQVEQETQSSDGKLDPAQRLGVPSISTNT